MPTLEEVKVQIGRIGTASALLGRKEIRELPSILWDDEQVEKLIQGFYGGGTGILVATNKRLVFVDKGLLYGLKVEDFPNDKISSIQYETGMLLGKVTIFTSGNRAVIEQVDKKQARDFAEYVRARISKPTEPTNVAVAAAPPAAEDFISQLERLGKLREQGVLSDEEFATQKQRILERSR